MVDRVNEILRASFPNIDPQLEELPDGRIVGSVTWGGFADLDHFDRQSLLRNELRKALGAEVTNIGVIFAYTPNELYAMKAA